MADASPTDKSRRWVFTKDEIAKAPSIVKNVGGMSPSAELHCRQLCSSLIQDIGSKLSVNQLCINTAIVYMHRFYMLQTMQDFNYQILAPSCLFLAAKCEEHPRKLEHVVKVALPLIKGCKELSGHENPDRTVVAQDAEKLSAKMRQYETLLLQTFGFDLRVNHPHTHVVKTCQLVRASKELTQSAYFLATNTLHLTTLCLCYSTAVLACMSVYLACKWSKFQIPLSNEGKAWYQYVDKTVTVELLEEISHEFISVIENAPLKAKNKFLKWKADREAASCNSPYQTLECPADYSGHRANVSGDPHHRTDQSSAREHRVDRPDGNVPGASRMSEAQMRRTRTEPNLQGRPSAFDIAGHPLQRYDQSGVAGNVEHSRTAKETADRMKLLRARTERIQQQAQQSMTEHQQLSSVKQEDQLQYSVKKETEQAAEPVASKTSISLIDYRSRRPAPTQSSTTSTKPLPSTQLATAMPAPTAPLGSVLTSNDLEKLATTPIPDLVKVKNEALHIKQECHDKSYKPGPSSLHLAMSDLSKATMDSTIVKHERPSHRLASAAEHSGMRGVKPHSIEGVDRPPVVDSIGRPTTAEGYKSTKRYAEEMAQNGSKRPLESSPKKPRLSEGIKDKLVDRSRVNPDVYKVKPGHDQRTRQVEEYKAIAETRRPKHTESQPHSRPPTQGDLPTDIGSPPIKLKLHVPPALTPVEGERLKIKLSKNPSGHYEAGDSEGHSGRKKSHHHSREERSERPVNTLTAADTANGTPPSTSQISAAKARLEAMLKNQKSTIAKATGSDKYNLK